MTLCCCSRCHCRSTVVLLKLFAILNFNFKLHSVKILLFSVKIAARKQKTVPHLFLQNVVRNVVRNLFHVETFELQRA